MRLTQSFRDSGEPQWKLGSITDTIGRLTQYILARGVSMRVFAIASASREAVCVLVINCRVALLLIRAPSREIEDEHMQQNL